MLSMELISDVDWMFDVDSDDILTHPTVSATVAPPTCNMDAIPTDDIWNKFDFGIETSEEDDGIFEPSSNISSSSFELYWAPKEQFKEIRHHDCMWAGLCGSKDHKNADSCILAYEDAKPAPLHIKSSCDTTSSSSSSSCCTSPAKTNETSTIAATENTISRTTLTNGTQITTVFKNSRTNSASPVKSVIKSDRTIVSGGNIVKVSIVDKKSTSLSSLKHLCTSSDSLSNDSQDVVHLMPLSEVTGQITRTLSTIELNPPVVDFDCANRDHNYGMVPPVPPPKSIVEIKREPLDIKQECRMDSDDEEEEEYDSRPTSGTVYMSPSSNGCSPGSKFDYGVQQVMSKYIKTEDLGVQTPSDSDEEVDVVSLYDIDLYESCKKPPTLITPPQSVLTSRATTPNYHHTQGGSVTKLQGHTSLSARSAAKRLIKSTLPTNPYDNFTSYEELQRNVAKVIKKSTTSRKKGSRKSAKKKSKKNGGSSGGSHSSKSQMSKSSSSYRQTSTGAYVSASGKSRQYEEYKKQYLADLKMSSGDGKKKKQYRLDLLPEKRKFHNNMERKRRVDLRNLFEELRELIPTLTNKKRAPKVQILNEAESLCNELSYKSKMQSKQAEELRREQARLRNAVAPLRHLFYEKNVSYLNH